ncbi:hypothetical protein CLPU_13c00280 [Gottschalkia purinilytica]|uniref:Uncharacterized protein n=1 Tax=Gottschalkia purinilytica TaxID=1503 RepID=A0A0L0W8B2_GOTPU|nr:hypothetical protein [Gottschalkia purinilytica]KNF07686.1 hypothetical protein CLPU_13c00280 [Gottschalkia purinilytica]
MISNIFIIISIQVSMKINGFIYFLKRIPILKKLFERTNYSFLKIKKFISALSLIYKCISGPIESGIIFLLTIYLPMNAILKGEKKIDGIFFSIVSFYFLLRIINSDLLDIKQEKFILVKQMKMHPKDYSLALTVLEEGLNLFSKIIVFIIFFKFINLNALLGVNVALGIVGFSLFVEAIHLYLFKKYGFSINNKEAIQVILFVLVVVGNYGVVFATDIPKYINLVGFFNSIITTIYFLILGIIGYLYIYKYDNYWDIINEKNTIENFKDINQTIKEAQFADVKMKEKEFEKKDLSKDIFNDKNGYQYLNEIFFYRHKRMFYRPMIIKSLIVGGVFIVLILINFFTSENLGSQATNVFIDKYTIFIFIMYLLCNSTRIIRSMFYNCDRSLLQYGFYKKGDALLKMFFLRLRKIVYNNIVPTIILCTGIFLTTFIYNPERLLEIIPVLFYIIVLALFFSIHYIFMYYIFQPFTTSLQMKNPFYGLINWIVYFIAYMSLKSKAPANIVLPIIIGFSIIYIIFAIILVYKKAPQTFRVK